MLVALEHLGKVLMVVQVMRHQLLLLHLVAAAEVALLVEMHQAVLGLLMAQVVQVVLELYLLLRAQEFFMLAVAVALDTLFKG
jgi:hypothetical protein